jgi:hypothetical protein
MRLWFKGVPAGIGPVLGSKKGLNKDRTISTGELSQDKASAKSNSFE